MLKLLFEFLTSSFSLSENPISNYIIVAVVGYIAFLMAYNIVGWFYYTDIIEGKGVGQILHWVIRLFIFVIIYLIAAVAIRIYKWVMGIPMYVWWVVMIIIIGIILIVAIANLILNRKDKVIK